MRPYGNETGRTRVPLSALRKPMEGFFMPAEHCPICARVASLPDDVCEHPKRQTTAPIRGQVTRRSILRIGALLFCAPAIVRAASLMPVRGVVVPIVRPYEGLVGRMALDWTAYGLISGRVQAGRFEIYGRIISEAEARRRIAYARYWGFLTTRRLAELEEFERRVLGEK